MTPNQEATILEALRFAQAVLNPISNFLKKGDKESQQYIEEVRVKIRTAIAIIKGQQGQAGDDS